MSNYSQFFLNSSANVIQLELLEISHPAFTKVYRIVRNAINGVTVTLEDASVKTFDYYPVQIKPTGTSNDLDQTLQLIFGDLGEILPTELDRVVVKPTTLPNGGALIGAWTDDAGNLVAPPFLIGTGCVVYVPYAATNLSMGINDHWYGDNWGGFNVSINGGAPVSVSALHGPWNYTLGGINNNYPFTTAGMLGVDTTPVTGGTIAIITVTGSASLNGTTLNLDALGNPLPGSLAVVTPGDPTDPGSNIPLDPNPGTYVKPTILYRTYRSDDLTQPLAGPFRFQIDNIAFQKEGATLQCSAPRLNLSATGEIYTMDRFPMLRGFL